MVMRYITIILLALLCAACSSALPSLKPYRMDIQQGNVVTSKMMLQLRPGMTKSQVRFIMGTPLIQDSFHANRWDYYYEMRKGGKIIERRRVILEFENDALKQVRGDVIPAGTGEPTTGPADAADTPKPKKKTQEKGLIDRLKFWKDDEAGDDKPSEVPAELVSPAAVPAAPAQRQPVPAPAQSAPQPAAEQPGIEPTREVTPERQEGMPEPGAPLGADPKDVERQTAPTVDTPQAREIGEAAPQPTKPDTETAAPVAKPAAPAAAPAPVPEKRQPAAQPQSTQQRQPARQTSRPEPQPEPDDEGLPPEDDPGYFERMLEKIGF